MSTVATVPMRVLERFTRRSVVGLAVVLLASALFAGLVVVMELGWPPVERFDAAVARTIANAVAGHPLVVDGLTAISSLGDNAVMWWLATVTAAGMLLRRQLQLAAYLVVTGLGALALTPLVMLCTRWLRSRLPERPTALESGFPSSHAVNAVVFYGALLLVFLAAIPRRFRPVAIVVVGTVIAVISLSRVALGVRYASDVVGGLLLGGLWLGATANAFQVLRNETGRPRRSLLDGLEPESAAALAPAHFRPVRHPWRTGAGLLVAWVFVFGVATAAGRLVTTAPAFDDAVPNWFAAHRTAVFDAVTHICGQAGTTRVIAAVGLAVGPVAMACVRRWRPAVFLAVTVLGELGLDLVVAAGVDRPRPDVMPLDPVPSASAFPSGHAAATLSLYGAVAVILVPRTRGWWRVLPVGLAVLAPVLVGLSGVYRGHQHPLDVAGGFLMALLWLTAVTVAVRPNADLHSHNLSAWRWEPPLAAPARDASGGYADGPDDAGRGPVSRSAVVANSTKMTDPAARRAEVTAALARAGWPAPEWLETTAADRGGGQTRRAVGHGAEVVFAAGGDGTVMACATVLAGTDVALAVLPMGTGNLLAANLGLPSRVADAVAVATTQDRRRMDLGVVEDRCFTVMAGMGFDAQMLHDAPATVKARIGWGAYALAAARHLCDRPMNVDISIDGAPAVGRRARAVLIGNVGRLQGGLPLLRSAVPDDGLLDVAVLMPPRRRDWLPLAWALVRRRRTVPMMETYRARRIQVTSDREQLREVDGDLLAPSATLIATVRPAALWMCVPRGDGR